MRLESVSTTHNTQRIYLEGKLKALISNVYTYSSYENNTYLIRLLVRQDSVVRRISWLNNINKSSHKKKIWFIVHFSKLTNILKSHFIWCAFQTVFSSEIFCIWTGNIWMKFQLSVNLKYIECLYILTQHYCSSCL